MVRKKTEVSQLLSLPFPRNHTVALSVHSEWWCDLGSHLRAPATSPSLLSHWIHSRELPPGPVVTDKVKKLRLSASGQANILRDLDTFSDQEKFFLIIYPCLSSRPWSLSFGLTCGSLGLVSHTPKFSFPPSQTSFRWNWSSNTKRKKSTLEYELPIST